jgi:hypothetical protein
MRIFYSVVNTRTSIELPLRRTLRHLAPCSTFFEPLRHEGTKYHDVYTILFCHSQFYLLYFVG